MKGKRQIEADDKKYKRQSMIVPTDQLTNQKIAIIGVGAVGRQVTLQLASMGFSWLWLIDPDNVEIHNLPTQGWDAYYVDSPKVTVAAERARAKNSQLSVWATQGKFTEKVVLGEDTKDSRGVPLIKAVDIVFSCVDTMSARKEIWYLLLKESLSMKLLLDSRVNAEAVRILTADTYDKVSISRYSKTLYTDEQAVGGNCTIPMTLYTANIAAGLLIAQFTKWLRRDRGLEPEEDMLFNILTSEITRPELTSAETESISLEAAVA